MLNNKQLRALAAGAFLAICSTSTLAAETMRVGTEAAFAPFEFLPDNSEELDGFDMDIIKAIAKTEGYEIQLSNMSFDGLIPALLTGSLDVAIAGFTITEERAKRVHFSKPYYDAGLGMLIRKDSVGTLKSADDLKNKTICVQIGTSGAMTATKISGAEVKQFNTSPDAFMELLKGGCEAVISDYPVIEYYLAVTKQKDVVLLPEHITVEQYGIITSKNNEKMQKVIEDGLQKIRDDGTYDKIYAKWFGSGAAK